MGMRTNTAVWLPNQQRWQIKVQKNGVRRTFTSAKPGRTGQREANRKADAWLDEGISNTRQVMVRRSINVHGEETHGKNENARRSFILTDTAAAILADQRLLTGAEDSVFDIQSESTYRHSWKRYCEANDIDYIPPYNLRHTFVSVAKTLPEGEVKPLVGHSRQMDTYGTYAHLLQGEEVQTAQALEGRLQKLLK